MPVIVCPMCGFNIQEQRASVGYSLTCLRCHTTLQVGGISSRQPTEPPVFIGPSDDDHGLPLPPTTDPGQDSEPNLAHMVILTVVGSAVVSSLFGLNSFLSHLPPSPVEAFIPDYQFATDKDSLTKQPERLRQPTPLSQEGMADMQLIHNLELRWGGDRWTSLNEGERQLRETSMLQIIDSKVDDPDDREATKSLLRASIDHW